MAYPMSVFGRVLACLVLGGGTCTMDAAPAEQTSSQTRQEGESAETLTQTAAAALEPAAPPGRIPVAVGVHATYGLLFNGEVDPGPAGTGLYLRLGLPLKPRTLFLGVGFHSSPLGWETRVFAELPLLKAERGRFSLSLGPELTLGSVGAQRTFLPLLGLGGTGRITVALTQRWWVEAQLSPTLVLCPGYSHLGPAGYIGVDTPVSVGVGRRWGKKKQ